MTIDDLALIFTRGIGSRTAARLVELFGSAERLFLASKDELVERAELRPEIAESIVRQHGYSAAYREADYCRRHNICMLAATDDDYPEALRATCDRPHVLFVRGSVGALSGHLLSMVGTRNMSPAGQDTCNKLVQQLGERVGDLCVVSGLAYGVDAACHRAALAYGVKTVAVIASALPSVTPSVHSALANDIVEHGGAIVSELHSQSPQNGALFLARNRIIAGLSMGTLVVESPASGGSLATADMADGYGRVVMAVPGRITDGCSFGTNNLIRSGKARLVLTAADIIEDVGWSDVAPAAKSIEQECQASMPSLQPTERLVYEAIAQSTSMALVDILDKTGLTMGELAMIIMTLELHGVIRKLPGQRYEVV
jgi:DNA processing protein